VGLIPQSFIDELIARADIVEVISTRVPLKKAGREFKACCPFHGEKTPSFWVSPEKQFYHCFGCGAHGTVLRFLMEHDRMPFVDAVEELAGRLGLTVPREDGAPSGSRGQQEPLYDLMGRVAHFYSDCLAGSTRAQEYVRRRGLTAETVERFGIGYAPNAWNEVLRRFGKSREERAQLAEVGLIIEREQPRDGEQHYDRFRDRLMFPIRDARGRVIAFGGRILDVGEPKYLNSPETVLFHKGRELYALYEARRSRGALQRLLVVEGYMDAVRLHQSGIPYAVATLGTATTPEHLRRLFRLVNEVVFSFDGDKAGRGAAWRALQHALPEVREGREIRFLFLPEGHDPDSLVGEEGREAFEKRVATQTRPLSDYLVEHLKSETDIGHQEGQARFAALAQPLFAKVPEGVFRDLLLKRLAGEIHLEPQRLSDLWNAAASGPSKPQATRAAPQPRKAGASAGAGRGTLIQQAITALLHFPPIAGQVSAGERAALEGCTERGIEHLRELLDDLTARPAQLSAQVIERWAEKPVVEHFQKLLGRRSDLLVDTSAAAAQLKAALSKLVRQEVERRITQLQSKPLTELAPEEIEELRRLRGARHTGTF
jgi:DNA primase